MANASKLDPDRGAAGWLTQARKALQAHAWTGLAGIAQAWQRPERVIDWATRALACDPQATCALLLRASARHDLKQFDQALLDFQAAGDETTRLFPSACHQRGENLYELKQYAEACVWFRAAIASQPYDPNHHSWLGCALKEAGQAAQALEPLRRAIELDPSLAGAHRWLGHALCALDRYEEAEAAYSVALRCAPRHAHALLSRAIAYHRLERYEDALADLAALEELTPDDAALHYRRGVVYNKQKRYADSVKSYERAIELRPDYADAHLGRGYSLSWQDLYREAIEAYDNVLRLDPKRHEAILWRGVARISLKELAAALEDLEEACRMKPDDATAHHWRGNCLNDLERYDDSLAAQAEALRLDPRHSEAFRRRGHVLSTKGLYREAFEAYSQCLELKPNDWNAWLWRGVAQQRLDRDAAACIDLDNARCHAPQEPTVHYWRGVTLHRMHRYEESLAEFQRALELRPEYADAFRERGHSLSWLDRYTEAIADYDECLKRTPDDANALLWRGVAHQKLKAYPEAHRDLERRAALKQDALVHYWRGVTFHMQRKFEESIAEYDAALKLNPGDFATHRSRGHALSWLDRWDEADQSYGEAARLAPGEASLWNTKALASRQLSEYDRAFDEIERAIRLEPRAADHIRQRATLWWWQANLDAALDDCALALEIDPKHAGTHELQGRLLCHVGDYELAIQSFDRALALDETNAGTLVHRSEAWDKLAEIERAAADLEAAVRHNPENGQAWVGRARLLQQAGDHLAALSALDKAVTLLPKDRAALHLRTRSLEALEEYGRADADYDALILLDEPDSDDTMTTTTATRLLPVLRAHFDSTPLAELELTERQLHWRMRPDLHRAVADWTARQGEVKHFSGIRGPGNHEGLSLADLIGSGGHQGPAMAVPPEYDDLAIGEPEPVRCVKVGIWLLEREGLRLAVISSLGRTHVRLQIAAPRGDAGKAVSADFVKTMEEAARQAAAYRGKVLSLDCEEEYERQTAGIRVHKLRQVERGDIVLPKQTLELLERNVLRFVEQRENLKSRGLSVKKGLLFYGPPGTGKTHTIHYLARALKGHTMFLVTAGEVGNLTEYMTLARLLQPSIVVLEDVDLIARSRGSMRSSGEESLLNRLLNEMDGLREDAEILFVLTTNHPEHLEKALASRPGRIDQAIEFPVPDEDGRAQLARLYAGKQELSSEVVQAIVERTQGVSASFIKELLRRATQFQLERDGDGPLERQDVERAMEELVFAGGALNAKLLGGVEARKVKGFSGEGHS